MAQASSKLAHALTKNDLGAQSTKVPWGAALTLCSDRSERRWAFFHPKAL